MYDVKSIVRLFTDHFRKDPESNTYKLMQLFSSELELLKETNDRILDWRDIDQAEGAALDLIGRNLNQPRGGANDEKYRILLKTKVARNLANGTINNFIHAVAYTLGVPKSEVKVKEMWEDGFPATLAINLIPLDKIISAGFTSVEFEQLLETLVAAGVQLVRLASFKTNTHIASALVTGECLSITPPIKTELDTPLAPSVAIKSITGECVALYPYIAGQIDITHVRAVAIGQVYGETLTIYPN